MKKSLQEFLIFLVVFPLFLIIAKFFFKFNTSYSDIVLIFSLAFLNITVRNFMPRIQEKYSLKNKDADFIRRMSLIAVIWLYFFLRDKI